MSAGASGRTGGRETPQGQAAMAAEPVLLESCVDGVLTLTMNRPERRNALTPQMCSLMRQALERAAVEPAVRVVVLTGAGSSFCSGGDVKAMAAAVDAAPAGDDRVRALRERMEVARLLHRIPKPTVAVVRGAAAGAGLALAAACDLRVAGASSSYSTAFGRVGLSGDYGGSYFLTQLLGPAKARQLYLLAPTLDAAEAAAIGLVDRVVEDDRLNDVAGELVDQLRTGPSIAYGHMKDNLNLAQTADLEAVMESEAWRHVACMATSDHAEAVRAFVEKRRPRFGEAQDRR